MGRIAGPFEGKVMSVRILYDAAEESAVLYCSTSMWAFGPLFTQDDDHEAVERAEAFLKWLDEAAPYASYEKTQIGSRRDARLLTDAGMQAAYSDWLAAEAAWFRAERGCEVCGEPAGEGGALCPACQLNARA